MSTPFQRHMKAMQQRQAQAAQQQAMDTHVPGAAEASASDYSAFELLKMSLEQDVRASKDVPSGPQRNELRDKTLLPRYQQHVQAYMESGEVYANPIMVQVMMWLFDVGRIEQALPIAKLAIVQRQQMPAEFKRDLATFVADTVLEWAETEQKFGRAWEPYFSHVFMQLETWQVPDVVRMKYSKFAGKAAFDLEDFQAAVTHLENAEKLSTSSAPAKVGTLLEKARKKIG